jgi:NADPH-dependent ferric siderophore reductase
VIPKPLTSEELKRRDEIHKMMLKGEFLHDGPGELYYIGDISSIPALLVVLKKNPPNANETMVCTTAHALRTLGKITGTSAGITYEAWNNWWLNYQKSQQIEVK